MLSLQQLTIKTQRADTIKISVQRSLIIAPQTKKTKEKRLTTSSIVPYLTLKIVFARLSTGKYGTMLMSVRGKVGKRMPFSAKKTYVLVEHTHTLMKEDRTMSIAGIVK
jgi:hypothetical protein